MKKVTVFDTTLRDGEQAPGNAMSVQAKIDMFQSIDATGIDIIEAGFPSASATDFTAIKEILQIPRCSKVCLFARAHRQDIDDCLRLFDGRLDNVQIQVLTTGSEFHLEHKRQLKRDDIFREVEDSLTYIRQQGVEVSLAVEDASRGSHELVGDVVKCGVAFGASTILITDTVGYATPSTFAQLIRKARGWVGDAITLSVHVHNDLGLATANTFAGLQAGADEFQGTLCGIGERAGNCSLEEVIAILLVHGHKEQLFTNVNPVHLHDAALKLSKLINFSLARNKAILGDAVYKTAAGIHQDGILRNPKTYEAFDPSLFGRYREFDISRHSGRAAIRNVLDHHGFDLRASNVKKIMNFLEQNILENSYHDKTAIQRILEF